MGILLNQDIMVSYCPFILPLNKSSLSASCIPGTLWIYALQYMAL